MYAILLGLAGACAFGATATGSGVLWTWSALSFLLATSVLAALRITGEDDPVSLLVHAFALLLAVVPVFLASPVFLVIIALLLTPTLASDRPRSRDRQAYRSLVVLLVVALMIGAHSLRSFTPIATGDDHSLCRVPGQRNRPCNDADAGMLRVSSWMTFYHPDILYYLGIVSQMAASGERTYTHPQFGGRTIPYPPGYFAFYAAFTRFDIPVQDVARALPPVFTFMVLASLLHCFSFFTGRRYQALLATLLSLGTFVTHTAWNNLYSYYPYLHWFKGTPLGVEAMFMTPQQAGLFLIPLCVVLFQRTFRDRTLTSAVLLGLYTGTLLNYHVLSALLMTVALLPSAVHKAYRGRPVAGLVVAIVVASLVAYTYLAQVGPSSSKFIERRRWYSKEPREYLQQFGIAGVLALFGTYGWWRRRHELEEQAHLLTDGTMVLPPPSGGTFLLWAVGSLVFINAFTLTQTHDIDRVMTLLCIPVGFFASFPLHAWASRHERTARVVVPLLLVLNSLVLVKIAHVLSVMHVAHPPVDEMCGLLTDRLEQGATVLVANHEHARGYELVTALCGFPAWVGNEHLALTWRLVWSERMKLYERVLDDPLEHCDHAHAEGIAAFVLPPRLWPGEDMDVWHTTEYYVVGDCIEAREHAGPPVI